MTRMTKQYYAIFWHENSNIYLLSKTIRYFIRETSQILGFSIDLGY